VEDLYESFGWELATEYGHILEAFKRLLTDGSILDKYTMSEDVKEVLTKRN
jgi:translation initiation factor 2 alpha subunit (eIF-2alpha)